MHPCMRRCRLYRILWKLTTKWIESSKKYTRSWGKITIHMDPMESAKPEGKEE